MSVFPYSCPALQENDQGSSRLKGIPMSQSKRIPALTGNDGAADSWEESGLDIHGAQFCLIGFLSAKYTEVIARDRPAHETPKARCARVLGQSQMFYCVFWANVVSGSPDRSSRAEEPKLCQSLTGQTNSASMWKK